jgi:sigma-E factor negative regulatory protein RseB
VLWLYWNRWRPAVLAAGLSLTAVAAVVIAAGSIVGGYPPDTVTGGVSGRTGAHLKPPAPRATSSAELRGMALMRAAAIACRSVPYSGVQMVAWWGPAGSSAYLIQIWHASGGPELAKETDGSTAGAFGARPSAQTAGPAAGGVLSVAAWMLSLMRVNYRIAYQGLGSASDRPARIIAVRRGDGTIAARYWLDAATNLPLRREVFDSAGRLVNEGVFIELHVGDLDADTVPTADAPPWDAQSAARSLAVLRGQGWSLPDSLAGNMALVGVTRRSTPAGPVVDASYSDGLSVVSVFTQRGEIEGALPGWHIATVHGEQVYSDGPDDRSLAWSADGLVYTVLADAPPDAVQRIVIELPHQQRVGFWQRVSRGLGRMGSWLDPFG